MNDARLVQELLESAAQRLPDKTALVCGCRRVSYQDLDRMANRAAHALQTYGVQRNDRVGICLPNDVESVAAIFGVLKAGAVFVLLSPSTKDDKLCLLLNDCGAAGLFCSQRPLSAASMGAPFRSAVPSLKVVVACGSHRVTPNVADCAWERIQQAFPSEAPSRVTIDLDLASILYTSGTTGHPKGVMSDHSNMLFAVESIATYLESVPEDIVLSVLPLSFGYGLNQVLLTFATGGTLVLEPAFAYPAAIIERMGQERVTGFPAVPTVFALLIQSPQRHDFSSVRYLTNAAAGLPEAHMARVRALFPNAQLFSMYGLTETTRALYLPPRELDRRPDSVGIAIPGTEVWIENEDGERVAPGGVGELVVRGRHVARGYWNNPAATQERFRPGAIDGDRSCYTGDLFRVDSEGFYYFVARKDDVIKSRGLKVPPKEIEEVLHRLEGVVEAAVFGVPDPILGQAIEVVLVTRNAQLTRASVLTHCRAHLDDFMVPRAVHFVPALPRTASGKIRRTDLPLCVVLPAYST